MKKTVKKIYCENVADALACGWLEPYVGKNNRIYGKVAGNHRSFRCFWNPYNPYNPYNPGTLL
jgi:hypothetical protein